MSEQGRRGHDLTGLTAAAMSEVLCQPGLQHRMRRIGAQLLDDRDTPSGPAQRHQRKFLEQDLRGELRGVGRRIVLRRDLDHVRAHDGEPGQRAQ